MPEINPRKVALSVLVKLEKSDGYSAILLDSALKKSELSGSDAAFVTSLVLGVVERRITLDYYISSLSSIPLDKIEADVRNILRMGIYQMAFMRVPPHAAVNECVDISTKRGKGFVNAILRNYDRKKDAIKLPDDPTENMSVAYSVPTWLCEKLADEYGREKTEEILSAYNEIPKVSLRVNTLKTDRDALLSKFVGAGYDAKASEISPVGIDIENAGAIAKMPGFDGGEFFVQDVASQVCVAALGMSIGESFLDMCSAPGSKSFGAAMYMKNEGKITSSDLHASKLSLIRSGAVRLGIKILEAVEADARIYNPAFAEKFDAVLCDVPCSGYGVVAKKPEIRYKKPENVELLPQLQYEILENGAKYVKRGGRLVYSTCTILREENFSNIERFLAEHDDFKVEKFEFGGVMYDGLTQFLPSREHDGFFIAKLVRK